MFMSLTMPSLSIGPDGRILYQDKKGVENVWRKHERSSGTSDIRVLDNGKHTKLTDFNGHDLNPVWAPDGSFYFVSEEDGTLNVYKRSVDGRQKKQLTNFTTHPVRSLSASKNGTLAFSWDGEIYTMNENGKPEKVNVEIITDDYASPAEKSIRRSGATSIAVSPDGETVAFVLRGDVYVTSTEYNTTRRITDTPAQERSVDFAPDGRSIVYDSDRDGIRSSSPPKSRTPRRNRCSTRLKSSRNPSTRATGPLSSPITVPTARRWLSSRTALLSRCSTSSRRR